MAASTSALFDFAASAYACPVDGSTIFVVSPDVDGTDLPLMKFAIFSMRATLVKKVNYLKIRLPLIGHKRHQFRGHGCL